MMEPAVGQAFIPVQTAPGPEVPFAHVMCIPESSSCMQNTAMEEMGDLCSLQ